MRFEEMFILKKLLEETENMTDRIYYLSKEERLALQHFNAAANMGEDYRIFLLQMAQDLGIEPGQLIYLRRLAEADVTAIE